MACRIWSVPHDDPSGLIPRHEIVRECHRRLLGFRFTRTRSVMETLIPTILEQKVTGYEGRRAFRGLVSAYSQPAPGPGDLKLPPDPAPIAREPYWALHKFGIERRRAQVLISACAHAAKLERTCEMPSQQAQEFMRRLPGIGAWTAAEVAQRAFGDADAVSVGDFHIPHVVTWALAREPRGTDARMLELLAPYDGHRGRVIRLLELSGVQAPAFGPRRRLRSIARI
jgi:3-methyladenine DNA glycosylase/8-oxoguanine DNA glycosylase